MPEGRPTDEVEESSDELEAELLELPELPELLDSVLAFLLDAETDEVA